MADLRQAFDESYYRLMGGGVSIADKGDSLFNRRIITRRSWDNSLLDGSIIIHYSMG